MRTLSLPAVILLSLLSLPFLASAHCECGYSVNSTSDSSYGVFTDLFETDFLHLQSTTGDTGWQAQMYNVSTKDARGPYGKQALTSNVIANPLANRYDWGGVSIRGGDPGLQLWVRSKHPDGLVPMAEIVGERTDMWYGSFRVAMKTSSIPGTCGAFFWFRNDTQEIDLEFLSVQLNSTSHPVNLVVQSPASAAAGFDASETPTFDVYQLPFDPSEGYHEYRFDWLPGRVSFYADGRWLRDMTVDAPTAPGRLILNHWSNGDPAWSGGPPGEDAVLTVSYVKAYFNSSEMARQSEYAYVCGDEDALDRVCQIPDQTTPPEPTGLEGNGTGKTYFFTLDEGHTTNQTVYNITGSPRTDGAVLSSVPRPIVLVAVAVVVVRAFV